MSVAATQKAQGKEKTIYPALDHLRFLAALMVLLYHLRTRHWAAWSELEVGDQNVFTAAILGCMRFGGPAVLIFFCLSGYLVGGLVLERRASGNFRASDYAIDRLVRIYLPLLPAIGLAFFCACLSGNIQSGWWQYLGNILSLQEIWVDTLHENPPLWSISHEVWLYIIGAGFALSFSPGRVIWSRPRVWGVLVFILALYACWHLNMYYLSCWLAGALAYRFRGMLMNRRVGICGLIAATGAAVLFEFTSGGGFDMSVILLALGCSSALPWLAALPMPSSLAQSGHLLAAFSYSLYLIHYPLMMLWYAYFPAQYSQMSVGSFMYFLLVVLVILAISWLYHLFFERPVGHIRSRIKHRLRRA
jgi:peptidoglycan/LPS O-acetylase OafA/YrhL